MAVKYFSVFSLAERTLIGQLKPPLLPHLRLGEKRDLQIAFSKSEFVRLQKAAREALRPKNNAQNRKSLQQMLATVRTALTEVRRTRGIHISHRIYQFKVFLAVSPPVWRRIQVPDCSLGELHEYVSAALEWPTCRTHRFIIGKNQYCDFLSLEELGEPDSQNSDTVHISKLFCEHRAAAAFQYVYNLRLAYLHDLHFEGAFTAQKGIRYPVCVEGQRTVPIVKLTGFRSYSDQHADLANRDLQVSARCAQSRHFTLKPFSSARATARMRKRFASVRARALRDG